MLTPSEILKGKSLPAALKVYLKYCSVWAAVFLITNCVAALAFHDIPAEIVEYLLVGLLILFVGLPVIELTKGLLLYLIGKGFGIKWSYEKAAKTTLYSSFPMVIFYPLLAVIFIEMLTNPFVFSASFITNLIDQFTLLSGVGFIGIPITLLPILLKLVVCIRTLARTQKIGLAKATVISTSALILVVLVFAVSYTYLTIFYHVGMA